MVRHARNKKRRAGRIGRVKLKNKSWNRWDPKPKIADPTIRKNWDPSKSPAANLERMGLIARPNGIDAGKYKATKPDKEMQAAVIEVFDVPESDRPSRKCRFPLTKEEEVYIAKCMSKWGDDYARMFRDVRGVNKMQHTKDKLRKMGSRFLLLSPEQRQVEVPENVRHMLPDTSAQDNE